MDEHQCDSSGLCGEGDGDAADSGEAAGGGSARGADRADGGFDYPDLLNRLRCRSTEWLRDRRSWLVREQRRLRVEELAVTAVLDERGAVDDTWAATDGVSLRQVRATLETARALESLPQVAAAAHAGRLSDPQLTATARLADPQTDAEWARRAPDTTPADLERQVRCARTPTAVEAQARRRARYLGCWWRTEAGMLEGRFSLPDVDGALFEAVINEMVDRMRPAPGQPWETRARRAADALVELARGYADARPLEHTGPLLVVEVPVSGPATVVGIPLPDSMVERLRASASIEPLLVDHAGTPRQTGRREPAISPKTRRAVLRRDGRCRFVGCDRRHGLQVHHLWPRSWGGTDDMANLAAVCVGGGTAHHEQLAPHGPWLLLGNPNQPDGLRLVHRDELPGLASLAARAPARGRPPARAGPSAA